MMAVNPLSLSLRFLALGGVTASWVALTACNSNGDRFFPEVDVPDVYVLTAEDGGDVVPADILTADDISANTIFAEVGPARTTGYGGVTFEMVGTGAPVCLWVDPEIVFWNEVISARPSESDRKYAYPDNIYDDGDIDLFAGLSVYYTGSPGETIGDFVVQYEDSLGNQVPVSLAACPNRTGPIGDPVSGGRGAPDWCTLPSTDIGVSYTVLLRTWSTPLDDDRLSFGLLVANGRCEDLKSDVLGSTALQVEECLITGESLTPDGPPGPFYGAGSVRDRVWDHSVDFEEQYCLEPSTEDRTVRMSVFCDREAERMLDEGRTCEREVITDPANRCFCGDPTRSPTPGGAN
jgi:hypothetical protein